MAFEDYATKIGIDRYARIDEGSSMRIANYEHVPGWLGAYVYCLKYNDFESAELIRSRNEDTEVEARLSAAMRATDHLDTELKARAA